LKKANVTNLALKISYVLLEKNMCPFFILSGNELGAHS
jgi:hypothetical protein